MTAMRTPPSAVEGTRHDLWSLVRGVGVLGLLSTSQSDGEATDGKGDGDVIVVAVFLWVGDSFFSAGSGKLAILASQSHAQVKSPCDCIARIASSL